MQGIERVTTVAEKHLFAALGSDTHRRLEHAGKWLRRPGGAGQGKSWEHLSGPIFVHDACGPLHQFLAVRLHPLSQASVRLLGYHLHRTLLSGFSLLHWEALLLGSFAEFFNSFA